MSDEEFSAILKPKKIKLLSKYENMNKKVSVKCLVCDTEWSTFAGNLKLHGCPTCAVSKIRETMLSRYGVEHSSQLASVKLKRKTTMLSRYGVDHALQSKELFDKNLKTAYKYKTYHLGKRKVKVQGYEPQALDYIRSEKGIKPSQIECGIGNSKIPSITYNYKGNTKVYHPDIFIPHLNLIVEVKSEFTYQYSRKINRIKRKAAIASGYRFVFLVMNKDGTRNYEYQR
jgi:hypothetical protein